MKRSSIKHADVLEVIDYLEGKLANALAEQKGNDNEREGYGYPRLAGKLEGTIEAAVTKLRVACGEASS